MKKLSLALGLFLCLGVNAAQSTDKSSILEYAHRTAKDYCSPKNVQCITEFSNQVIMAFKDGQMDSRSRFRENSLSDRYENRLLTTECIPSDVKYKEICESMVDRLVDSYNRGLNSK
ncbi:valyl-tRNA synthetase modifier [Klebsiella phage PhiKpNIH-6]|jgi:hypothetical protein|uniref:Valyl-tRNA synthetase n=4 Tax=Marfavirus F48 TaxID=2845079 RepID=A0A5P8PJR4_9CAUD|nr:putative valyl-tRNA synthase [Klebsiella phage vB_KpnM_Potts1]QEM42314.1 valyl-tRNA synthetase modifier [Klebsiella phage EI]QFR56967.1 valyl-tRNA synthetase [Klebsiella phage AmPh_EK29]QGZ15175.1 valyl-tRNA synthetase [Klebsiella phage vB_Kpn_P545]QHB49455.1 valyl-tRNA synthetase modifier [Klebsiella phage PhiKpNIH-6]UEP19239.1 putative valyl-tRNA synthase [Klebsiella phage vB_KpnM-VAC36]UJD05550.1 valyl-tRNA synthetase [Klebsiella phage PWKp16]UJD05732.1 valyl-tRNA synthetase [Klebsiell